ncbi:MAG: hypothetical protein K9W43_13775 [Candidatus Thorarchaeota archaeon]|nr:hypothetical protein [Candidatus Thorarchaeota archaeon]
MDLSLFLVGLGLSTGFVLITIIFWLRERKTGRKVYFLKEATALGTLTGIANLMKAGPEVDVFGLGPDLLQWFVLTSWSIVFGMLGFFFLSMRHESPPWKQVSLAVALGVTELTAGLATLPNPVPAGNPLYLTWKVCFSLLGLYIFSYGAKVYIDAQRRRPEIRSLLMSLALSIVAVSYLPVILTYDLPNYLGIQLIPGINTETATDYVRIVTLIIIVLTLLSDMEYFYRIPTELYAISVVAESGISLYSYGDENVDIDPNLLASALTAISVVVKESSGSTKPLRRIATGDRIILVVSKPEQEFSVTALAERSSLVLVRSLQVFADFISEEIGDTLATDTILALDKKKIDGLVFRAFPFLKVSRSK